MPRWRYSVRRGLAPFDLPLNVAWQIEIDLESYCWNWTGTSSNGYGMTRVGDGKRHKAHRFVYGHLLQKVSPDLQIDHLCANHSCVNPDHLEPVTAQENTRRMFARLHGPEKLTCKRGHLWAQSGVLKSQRGRKPYRICRECTKESARRIASKAVPSD